MKKYPFLLLLPMFLFSGVANTASTWITAMLDGKELLCDGTQTYYISTGAWASYAFEKSITLCLNSDKSADFLVFDEDGLDSAIHYGENCILPNDEGWKCKTLIETNSDSFEMTIDESSIKFFDEETVFGSGIMQVILK